MKREYKIAHLHRENERIIFREFEGMKQWLDTDMRRTSNKKLAMRFLHEQEVISALSIVKTKKWELKTEEQYIEEKIEKAKEKRSWSEL